MSLLAALPAPSKAFAPVSSQDGPKSTALATIGAKEAPPYLRRQGFVPRRTDDFGDGGAFPEIHVAQYPLNMGRADRESRSDKTLAVTLNADGELNYDAILKQGKNKDKIIHSDHQALVPKVDKFESIPARPDEEEEDKTAKETLAALQRVIDGKLSAAQPTTLPPQPGAATYIKYTPSQQGAQFASGAKQRIIKMQDLPIDPLEPPKFRHKKVPRGAGSPPVPVMHSPPRPLTVKDMQDWKIPPSISNWKNPKGYTIPLDKRLAADGRGLQESTISDKFAQLSEALYIAEQKAREAVEMRSKIQKKIMEDEKRKRETELRDLAMQARMQRVGAAAARADDVEDAAAAHAPPPPAWQETGEEREERRKRDEIRDERRRERERERRLEAKDAHGSKKSKITRDRDRDVSEKIALGLANVGQGLGSDVMYDQRLFNQEQGLSAGFGKEDDYSLYDKPLFADRGSNLFRPKSTQDDELYGTAAAETIRTDKFKADRGFQGADVSAGPRSKPVEFEREEADPFGLDQFLTEVKAGKKRALDGIGGSGHMKASGGGAGGGYSDHGSSGRRMDFQSGRG